MTLTGNNQATGEAMICANREGRVEQLKKWVGSVFSNNKKKYCLVSVAENALPREFQALPASVTRALIVFEDAPASIASVEIWREWAIGSGAWEVHVAFLNFFQGSDEQRFRRIVCLCKGWEDPIPEPELSAVEAGKFVLISQESGKEKSERNLATLLTMTLGSTGQLLTRVELLARRFRYALSIAGQGPNVDRINGYLRDIDGLLKGGRSVSKKPSLHILDPRDKMPKILLQGHSGTGKSLIASYVNERIGWNECPLRIPIPEFLGKEENFELDMFGYCKGAYTGGKEEGSRGLLLANTGRVVFLDEIGEANAYLQAKLLAFLDDFNVRPRGWEGDPFFCPILVVAATNKDLDEMVKMDAFREDLLARFTDRLTIPDLNGRKDDLPFILDCLLQRPAMNSDAKVKSIGQGAFDLLKTLDFSTENFRRLENLFRNACERANRDGRDYIVKADFENAESH